MNRPAAAALAAALLAAGCGREPPPAPGARTVADGTGAAVRLPDRPSRIVSCSLASDEILLALVGPERIAAVTALAADPARSCVPEEAKRVPRRIESLAAEAETLLALKPDLVVISPYNAPEAVEVLRRSGAPVFRLAPLDSLEGVLANIRLLGEAAGERAGAEALAGECDARLARLRARATEREPSVLAVSTDGWVFGPKTIPDDLLVAAGARNAARESGPAAGGLESLHAADPDVILILAAGDEALAAAAHPAWKSLRAVREGRVARVPAREALSASHHAAVGAERMAEAIRKAVPP